MWRGTEKGIEGSENKDQEVGVGEGLGRGESSEVGGAIRARYFISTLCALMHSYSLRNWDS